MSNTTKWLVVLVIVAILLGLWWGGLLGNSPKVENEDLSAAAVASKTDASDAKLAEESSAIDAQMKVVGNQFAAFSQAPTTEKANLLSIQLGTVANLMTKLSAKVQTRVSTLKSIGFNTNTVQGALSAMNLKLSYASTPAGVGGQLAASVKPSSDKTQINKNNTALQQAVIEFQKSHSYLQDAQKDIKTALQALASIDTSTVR